MISSYQTPAAPNIVNAASTHYARFIIQWASTALVWYDYSLTLKLEIKYIWNQRFRFSTVLYALCRYALISSIIYLFVIADKLGSSCDAWSKTIGALDVFGRLTIIITFTARTYVICDGNRYVLAYLGTLGLACLILSMIHPISIRCAGSDPQCNISFYVLDKDYSSCLIASFLLSVLMAMFELSSALLTSGRCLLTLRVLRGANVRLGHFFMLLFEQGILYIVWTSVLTVAAATVDRRVQSGVVCQIALPMSCVIAARFLLHLRRLEEQLENTAVGGSSTGADQEIVTGLGSLQFKATHMSSIVADLGIDANVDDQMNRYVSRTMPSSPKV